MHDRTYADHNATSILDQEIIKYLSTNYANPSSLHLDGQRARFVIENARLSLL